MAAERGAGRRIVKAAGPALRSPGLLVAVSALLFSGCFARQYRSGPRLAIAGGDPIVQMTPAEKMRSLDWAWMVPLARHSRTPDEDERILGVEIGGLARAYPIGLLDRFEVVNDEAGGVPLVVVRCGLTDVAAAWDRRVRGETAIFETTGALWRDTLVFRDRSTASLWSAATGEAIAGALQGERLRGVPASLARADRWDEVHPHSLYLDLGEATSPPLLMKIYRVSPMQGVSGEKTEDARYRGKQEVFVVAGGSPDAPEALAFTAREIERRDRVETRLAGEALTVRWDAGLAAPRAFAGGVERPAVPMFWFAARRHFEVVRTLEP